MSKPQGGLAEDAAHLFVAGEWRITLSLIRPKGYARFAAFAGRGRRCLRQTRSVCARER